MVKILLWGLPGQFPNYEQALRAAGAAPGWSGAGADPADFDGLLLPGGGDIAPWRLGAEAGLARDIDEVRDAGEFALTEQFLAWERPILGICRGAQVLNAALGGALLQHIESHGTAGCADRVHEARAQADSRPGRLYGTVSRINSAHHQALARLGTGLRAVQWAPDGIIEAVEHISLPVWGVQWHPERYPGGQKIYDLFAEEARAQKKTEKY